MDEDAAAFGLVVVRPERPEGFLVWPECWDAVDLFLRVQTQWRVGGSGVVGLDYGVAMAIADRLHASAKTIGLLEDLQVMEARARELINEQAKGG